MHPHPPLDHCDCLFRSVYSALCADRPRAKVEQTLGVSSAYDLRQRVLNEPGSAWTTQWEACYDAMYAQIARRGTSCASRFAPWVGRFFAADTLRSRRAFVQRARHHALALSAHATAPECLAIESFLAAHHTRMVVHRVLPTAVRTNESTCIHLFRTERGHFHPILDAHAARWDVRHYGAIHDALHESSTRGGASTPQPPQEAPTPCCGGPSSERAVANEDDDDHRALVRAERRALSKKGAVVRSKIEAYLLERRYTRCEVHYRNRQVVQILQLRPSVPSEVPSDQAGR